MRAKIHLRYKGYIGNIGISETDAMFYGKIIGINAHVPFKGDSVKTIIKSFHAAVDDYIALCAKNRVWSEKPFTGNFHVRIEPYLHRLAVLTAYSRGVSLNTLVEEAIRQFLSSGGNKNKAEPNKEGHANIDNYLEYKDYIGSIELSEKKDVFKGRIIGISQVISYKGCSVKTIIESFHNAVEKYLASCSKKGKAPEIPFKGSFNVRIGAELHRKAATKAYSSASSRKSALSAFVEKSLMRFLED